MKVIIHRVHFFEDDIVDGDYPHDDVRMEVYDTDEVEEAAAWIRLEGLSFSATGTEYAGDPDGSYIADYRTGERIETTAHIEDANDWEFYKIVELVG